MKEWPLVTRAVRGGTPWKLAIQQHISEQQWSEAIELVPEADREETRAYLRGMWKRLSIQADAIRKQEQAKQWERPRQFKPARNR